MSFHSPQLIYINQSSTFDIQIPNFFSWSTLNRLKRVLIEDSESLTFCLMNDLFAWRLILTSSMQHLDLLSWFKTLQNPCFFIRQILNHLMKIQLFKKFKLWLFVNFFKIKLFPSSNYFKWSIMIIKNQEIWKSQQKVKIFNT